MDKSAQTMLDSNWEPIRTSWDLICTKSILGNYKQADYKTTYKDVPEYCKSASFEDLQANDFSLVPSKYIEFVDKDSGIDFDTEMKRIQQDFKTLLQEEQNSQEQLKNAFKTLGYSLEP